MFPEAPAFVMVALLAAVTGLALLARWLGAGARTVAYFRFLWVFFLLFAATEILPFSVAIWILAVVCFVALREYFSLLDIRFQDRWGILGAYASIPFMIAFIQVDWYGMFIISIPVYTFLVIPFLIALGGKEKEGIVFSIGSINFGLFLLVYCVGHIGYLTLFSTWMAAALVLCVAVCDLIAYVLGTRGTRPWTGNAVKYLAAIPAALGLMLLLSAWTGIPWIHSVVLGCLIPVLVGLGRYTIAAIESDLRISVEHLEPGRGRLFDSITSSLYAAPVVFHYIRYFLT
jgi:phosphatidate cytidylyltransferase